MSLLLTQTLNGLTFASLLFLMASGFTLIFGLMRVPNMAHGALFMLGAYLAVTLLGADLPFAVAALLAAVLVGVLGVFVERVILARIAGNELAQVLATLGIAFVIADACRAAWGGMPLEVASPEWLSGTTTFAGTVFPLYRLFVVGVAVAIAIALDRSLSRTTLGARLRAAVDDRVMARAVGIPVDRLFVATFFAGAALVGLAGVIGAPILSVFPGLDMEVLPLVLIVVVLGGTGSIPGAFLGSVLTGFVYSFGQTLLPELSYVLLFVPMIAVLALRPQGLCGRKPS
ncbi:branched-chain amino acid ABC transporter permease [Cupriavidus basilensis]|uniref:High-affinity branched-chain amino acid transport system permease protein LivH n=1 Tax=Cupriavidus basilensis TaxID=68895 RepID=A0A0C4Y959_9BURK|nr:branched-chain amino acid ABC transporter permease [Cupriavidus basilensis]AJG19483.1 High-affinity branched-chain amino acid transport system permease protein LivH [Cupriavidus basilensis]